MVILLPAIFLSRSLLSPYPILIQAQWDFAFPTIAAHFSPEHAFGTDGKNGKKQKNCKRKIENTLSWRNVNNLPAERQNAKVATAQEKCIPVIYNALGAFLS